MKAAKFIKQIDPFPFQFNLEIEPHELHERQGGGPSKMLMPCLGKDDWWQGCTRETIGS